MPLATAIQVSNYGVVGDFNPATNTGTDDTAAIQAAFNAARPGDTVIFPAPLTGRAFKISSAVLVNKRLKVDFNNAEFASRGTGGFNFDTGSGSSIITGLFMKGQRDAGGVGIRINDGYVTVRDSHFELMDTGINVPGGIWHLLDNITMRNIKTGGIALGNIIGTRINKLCMDTDTPTYPQPSFGIKLTGADGTVISNCDIIQAGDAVIIETGPGLDCVWNILTSCTFDTSGRGVVIRNYQPGIRLTGVFLDNCWSSSHATAGIQIDGNQTIEGVTIKNCHLVNNQQHALINTGAVNNLDVSNCEFGSNSASAPNTYWNIYTNATGNKQIRGNTFGTFGAVGGQVLGDVTRGTSDGPCVFSENFSNSGAGKGAVLGAGAVSLQYGINYGNSSPSR